jgi:hypothetical protein
MLAITGVRHDRDDYTVTAARLAGSEREHNGLEAAYFAGGNDLKNCPPRTVVARSAGALYT